MEAKNTASLIILAHQDDEIGIFPHIQRMLEHGELVWICYLTSGTMDGSTSFTRNQESLTNLIRLGVAKEHIIFSGSQHQIADKALCLNLAKAYQALQQPVNRIAGLSKIYVMAWEGGHPDHDAAHLLGVTLARELNMLDNCFQFPLYNSVNLPKLRRVRLFNPLAANGPVTSYKIGLAERWLFLRLACNYTSQKKVLWWLLPLLIYHYIFRGTQILQAVSWTRIFERPDLLALRYEYNGFYSYPDFREAVTKFIQDHS